MKRILVKTGLIISLLHCEASFSGLLFNVNVNATSNILNINTVTNNIYKNAGIMLNSPGFSLSNVGTECIQSPNGLCTFSVSNIMTKNISITGNGFLSVKLCLNSNGLMTCQNYNNLFIAGIPTFALVNSYNGSAAVYACSLNQTTGAIISCSSAGGGSVISGTAPEGIVVNAAQNTAFLTGGTDEPFVYQCPLNASTGTFGTCTRTEIITPSGYDPQYGMLALNPANTIAYLGDATGRILACPISNNVILGTCTDTGATNINNTIAGINLNRAGTMAYIANYENFITVCKVNGSTFSSCIKKTGGSFTGGVSIPFIEPGQAALNGAETLVYVTDFSPGKVYACSTTPNNTSSFASCFVAGSITNAWGITINARNTMAYITDFNNTVTACRILTNGTFSSCTTNTSISEPVGIALVY